MIQAAHGGEGEHVGEHGQQERRAWQAAWAAGLAAAAGVADCASGLNATPRNGFDAGTFAIVLSVW